MCTVAEQNVYCSCLTAASVILEVGPGFTADVTQ